MLDNFDKLNLQMRILIATAISLLFFIPYSYFFAPVKEAPLKESTSMERAEQQAAPQTSSSPKEGQVSSVAMAETSPSKDIIATVQGSHFRLEIDSLGRIAQVYLKDAKFLKEQKELPLLAPLSSLRPLEVRFSDATTNKEAFAKSYYSDRDLVEIRNTPETLTLTQELEGFKLTKKLTFYPDGNYDLEVETSGSQKRFFSLLGLDLSLKATSLPSMEWCLKRAAELSIPLKMVMLKKMRSLKELALWRVSIDTTLPSFL